MLESKISPGLRRKKLLRSINILRKEGLIDLITYDDMKDEIDILFEQWKKELPTRKKGRKPRGRRRSPVCLKAGCSNMSADGQSYCCRSHSPCGDLYW